MHRPTAIADGAAAAGRACDELSRRLRAGLSCQAEELLAAEPEIADDTDAVLELLYTEFLVRQQLGQQPQISDWLDRFPKWHAELAQLFEVHAVVEDGTTQRVGLSGTQADDPSGPDPSQARSEFIGGYAAMSCSMRLAAAAWA
jgi:hypothetical protein